MTTEAMGVQEAFHYAIAQRQVEHPSQPREHIYFWYARPVQADAVIDPGVQRVIAIAKNQEKKMQGEPYDEELLNKVASNIQASARFWASRWSILLGKVLGLDRQYYERIYPPVDLTATELFQRMLQSVNPDGEE